jgi:hypothetical protein
MRKVTSGVRAEIPEAIGEVPRNLIKRCWAADPDNCSSFDEILFILDKVQFGVTPDVDPTKVQAYVTAVSHARPTTK